MAVNIVAARGLSLFLVHRGTSGNPLDHPKQDQQPRARQEPINAPSGDSLPCPRLILPSNSTSKRPGLRPPSSALRAYDPFGALRHRINRPRPTSRPSAQPGACARCAENYSLPGPPRSVISGKGTGHRSECGPGRPWQALAGRSLRFSGLSPGLASLMPVRALWRAWRGRIISLKPQVPSWRDEEPPAVGWPCSACPIEACRPRPGRGGSAAARRSVVKISHRGGQRRDLVGALPGWSGRWSSIIRCIIINNNLLLLCYSYHGAEHGKVLR
ncbi:hypothetical protein D3C81_762700 [compost metagenome]